MKQIAIIGLALVPLLAGCAGDMLGPGKAPDTAHLDTQSIPDIQSQLKKLKWRVRSLKRQVSQQKPRGGGVDRNEIQEIKKRISELETLGFNFRSGQKANVGRAAALPPQAEVRLASLETKLKRMEAAQARTASRPASGAQSSVGVSANDYAALAKRFEKMEQGLEKDRSLVIDFLEDLDNRLSSLEEPKPNGNASGQSKKP